MSIEKEMKTEEIPMAERWALWLAIEPMVRKRITKSEYLGYVDDIMGVTMEEFLDRCGNDLGEYAACRLAMQIAQGKAVREVVYSGKRQMQTRQCPHCRKSLALDNTCQNDCCELFGVIVPTSYQRRQSLQPVSLESIYDKDMDQSDITSLNNNIPLMTYDPYESADIEFREFKELRRADQHKLALSAMLRDGRLTDRESQICNLLIEGIPGKHIAELLEIQESTVSRHKASIQRKVLEALKTGEVFEIVDDTFIAVGDEEHIEEESDLELEDAYGEPALVRLTWFEGRKRVTSEELVLLDKIYEFETRGPVQLGFTF